MHGWVPGSILVTSVSPPPRDKAQRSSGCFLSVYSWLISFPSSALASSRSPASFPLLAQFVSKKL